MPLQTSATFQAMQHPPSKSHDKSSVFERLFLAALFAEWGGDRDTKIDSFFEHSQDKI
jgi:hypothetical protein